MARGRRNSPRIREEIRFHRDRLIEDYMAEGLDRGQAERRAFLELGNPMQIEEAVRDVRGRWIADLWQDLRYALRVLRRSPGFATVAILSLALGIGANAAIFSLVNAVVLQTLPVPAPDQLVQIARLRPDGQPGGLSYPLFEHFRDNLQSASGVVAFGTGERAIVINGRTEFVSAAQVSGSYYSLLGVGAALGRVLSPGDDDPASPTAAVISDSYWQRRFGRRPAAVGATFTLDDRAVTIVGVTRPSFQSAQMGFAPDITLPLRPTMADTQRDEITNNWLRVLARLKPDRSVEQAGAEVEVLWQATLPLQAAAVGRADLRSEILRQQAAALPAADGVNPVRQQHSRSLYVLMGLVALLLLLACVNLSSLLVARAMARQREMSVRLAIGAGRGRLARQALTECLVLIMIGGASGLAIATWLSVALFALLVEGRTDIVLSVAPDWRVLGFTAVASLAACVVAGVAPVMHALRGAPSPALSQRQVHGSHRLGRVLVVAQLSISMVLVVGATLFIGTLASLHTVDLGFDSEGLLVVRTISSQRYSEARARAVQTSLRERLEAMPGVRSATATSVLPISGRNWTRDVRVEGVAVGTARPSIAAFNVVAPAYFSTLGTPLLYGRDFDQRDSDTSPKVAIVNESFVRRFLGATPALGRHVTSIDISYEIVGVVADAKYQSLREDGTRETMYIPWTQRPGDQPTSYTYLARIAQGDPMTLVPGVERLVQEVDASLGVRSSLTYEAMIQQSITTERAMATFAGLFGSLALIVAFVGVFGMLSFQVERRTNELGLRMALGANQWGVIRLVLHDVAVLVVAGVAIGAGAALMFTHAVGDLLFGLTSRDPRAILVSASVLAVASFAAAWFPTRRATRVDPLVALRSE